MQGSFIATFLPMRLSFRPKQRIKTPLSYYGGKQQMARKIIGLIPEHTMYVEPYLGGGAVFRAKQPSEIEVVNDRNVMVANFYRVCQSDDFPLLEKLVKQTPYSRAVHNEALALYRNPDGAFPVRRARAFRYLCSVSFSANIGAGMAYDKQRNQIANKFANKKMRFDKRLAQRLDKVCVEQQDALKLIQNRDSERTFFYLDPPYLGMKGQKVDQGHYRGFTEEDYEALLSLLSTIKGKFLLSNYPSEQLDKRIGAC